MLSVAEFREHLNRGEIEYLLDHVLLGREAEHVTEEDIEFVRSTLAGTFRCDSGVEIWIVGSAKLGFSTIEKREKDGTIRPRYRPFSPSSDIDIAVVSNGIFTPIWDELSAFSHQNSRFPWNSGRLGDYLVCGWLRPDHFPQGVRLRKCDDWWDTFRAMSADHRFGRRKVSGGLFASVDHLRQYYLRSLNDCLHAERLIA